MVYPPIGYGYSQLVSAVTEGIVNDLGSRQCKVCSQLTAWCNRVVAIQGCDPERLFKANYSRFNSRINLRCLRAKQEILKAWINMNIERESIVDAYWDCDLPDACIERVVNALSFEKGTGHKVREYRK